MGDHGFKIIGLKPLQGCSAKFLKTLKEEEIYFFYNNYSISVDDKNEEFIVISEQLQPANFYSDGLPVINISAIVGKNGSGKSALVELLYAGLYNLSRRLRLLPKYDEEGKPYLKEEAVFFELYYYLDSQYFKIKFDSNIPVLTKFNDDGHGYEFIKTINKQADIELFYTIVINYSHYALNSEEIGSWVKSIFHKNDAYQTPVVLNPFRDKGTININTENHLVRSRLLTNIVVFYRKNFETIKSILNNKEPRYLILDVDFNKVKLKANGELNLTMSNNFGHRIFSTLYEIFFGNLIFEIEDTYLNKIAKEYILAKLKSITRNYKHYRRYRNFYAKNSYSKLRAYLSALKDDKSHITFKLRQAINFLRFNYIYKKDVSTRISILDLSKTIEQIVSQHADIESIELVPPAFLKIDMEFTNSNDNFSKLSSGEKQKIYSLSSLIYHLKNIDSVHFNPNYNATPTSKELIRYKYINIVFDEVELYYHPEFQRTFVYDIILAVKQAALVNIKGVNFLFITHSPFILSDIPRESILFLEISDGFSSSKNTIVRNTFGANIHELLSTSFFLDEALMGKFAKQKIQKIIDWCNSKDMQDSSYYQKIIELIDEPIIRVKLSEMFAEKMGENLEIARLHAQRAVIDRRLLEIGEQ